MVGANLLFRPPLSLIRCVLSDLHQQGISLQWVHSRFGWPNGQSDLTCRRLLLATRGTVFTPKLLGCDAVPLVPCRSTTVGKLGLFLKGRGPVYNPSNPQAFCIGSSSNNILSQSSFPLFDRFPSLHFLKSLIRLFDFPNSKLPPPLPPLPLPPFPKPANIHSATMGRGGYN